MSQGIMATNQNKGKKNERKSEKRTIALDVFRSNHDLNDTRIMAKHIGTD